MVKRSHSTPASVCSSEYEEKPSIASSDHDDSDIKPPGSKKRSPSKKARKSPTTKKSSTPREKPRVWTPTEDEIFHDIMAKVLKSKMWQAILEDGRLGYRGSPGIQAHIQATMNKLKAKKV